MLETRQEAERRFAIIRHEAYQVAQEEFRATVDPSIRVSQISEEALLQAQQWRRRYAGIRAAHEPGWNWDREVRKFRRRPRRVEVAFWAGDQLLCGLALGRVSDRRIVATIHFIEADPAIENTLSGKVGQLAARFLEIYAVHLGCSEIAIDSPLPELTEFYAELGFRKFRIRGRRVIRMSRIIGA